MQQQTKSPLFQNTVVIGPRASHLRDSNQNTLNLNGEIQQQQHHVPHQHHQSLRKKMSVLEQLEPSHPGKEKITKVHQHTYDEAVKSFGDTYAIEIHSPVPSPAKRSLNLPEIKLNSYQSDSADPKSANYMIVEQFVDSEMSKSGGSSEIVSDSRKTSVEIGQKQRSPSHQTEYGKKYLNVSPVKLQDSSSYDNEKQQHNTNRSNNISSPDIVRSEYNPDSNILSRGGSSEHILASASSNREIDSESLKSPSAARVLSNSKLFETTTYDTIEDPAIRESLRQVDIAYQNMINLSKLDFG